MGSEVLVLVLLNQNVKVLVLLIRSWSLFCHKSIADVTAIFTGRSILRIQTAASTKVMGMYVKWNTCTGKPCWTGQSDFIYL